MVSPFSFRKVAHENHNGRAFSMPKKYPQKTGMFAHGYVRKSTPYFFLKKNK